MPEQLPEPTPEELADLNSRVQSFNAELIPLLGKYSLGLTARPFIADGLIYAKPHLFNDPPKPENPEPAKVESGLVKES